VIKTIARVISATTSFFIMGLSPPQEYPHENKKIGMKPHSLEHAIEQEQLLHEKKRGERGLQGYPD